LQNFLNRLRFHNFRKKRPALPNRNFLRLSETDFKEVYREHWKRLYGLSYNYVRDKAAAQEIVQEVFVMLWQKRDALAHVTNLEGYLMKCTKNKIYEHFEKLAAQQRFRKLSAERFREDIHPVEEEFDYQETLSLINQELEKLPATTRTIFRMSKFERYSNKEIANRMHVSAKAVEYHITRALKKLRMRLSHPLLYAAIAWLLS